MEREKITGIATLISDAIDFILKNIKRDEERHYINSKGSIQQEEIKRRNVYTPTTRAPSYMKQLLMDLRDIQMPIQ